MNDAVGPLELVMQSLKLVLVQVQVVLLGVQRLAVLGEEGSVPHQDTHRVHNDHDSAIHHPQPARRGLAGERQVRHQEACAVLK